MSELSHRHLRIVQVVWRFPPSIGGTEVVVYETSKELARRGHKVTVITMDSQRCKTVTGQTFLENFEVIRFKPDMKVDYYEMSFSLLKTLLKIPADIFIFHVLH
jgi:glycosyltransferase involved in cell wall biosynthesis